MINIEGLDKAELLVALNHHALCLGYGNLTLEGAKELLQNCRYLDKLGVDLSSDKEFDKEFDETLYDKVSVAGAALYVVNNLRLKPVVDMLISIDNNEDIQISDEKEFMNILDIHKRDGVAMLIGKKIKDLSYKNFSPNFYLDFFNDIVFLQLITENNFLFDYFMAVLSRMQSEFFEGFCKQTLHNKKWTLSIFVKCSDKLKENFALILKDGHMSQDQYNTLINKLDEFILSLKKIIKVLDPIYINVANNDKIEIKDEKVFYQMITDPNTAFYIYDYVYSVINRKLYDATLIDPSIFRSLIKISKYLNDNMWDDEKLNSLVAILKELNYSINFSRKPDNLNEFLLKVCKTYFKIIKFKIDNLFNTNQIDNDIYQSFVSNMDNIYYILKVNFNKLSR